MSKKLQKNLAKVIVMSMAFGAFNPNMSYLTYATEQTNLTDTNISIEEPEELTDNTSIEITTPSSFVLTEPTPFTLIDTTGLEDTPSNWNYPEYLVDYDGNYVMEFTTNKTSINNRMRTTDLSGTDLITISFEMMISESDATTDATNFQGGLRVFQGGTTASNNEMSYLKIDTSGTNNRLRYRTSNGSYTTLKDYVGTDEWHDIRLEYRTFGSTMLVDIYFNDELIGDGLTSGIYTDVIQLKNLHSQKLNQSTKHKRRITCCFVF